MSSLVSFLLKPYLFLTLNYFIVPKTFIEVIFLSLRVGAATRASTHRAGLGVDRAEGGGLLLGLSLAAHGCSGGDWGQQRWLRLLQGCDD